jgi:hypothetical protein
MYKDMTPFPNSDDSEIGASPKAVIATARYLFEEAVGISNTTKADRSKSPLTASIVFEGSKATILPWTSSGIGCFAKLVVVSIKEVKKMVICRFMRGPTENVP